jgi:hypothetical protein
VRLVIIFLFVSLSAYGQKFPSEFWHKGKLVTTEGDTLLGKLKYDLEQDVVQVDLNHQILTFGAKKIIFFEIFDVTIDNYRQFYSIPYSTAPGYKSEVIFEVLYEGKLTLLTRESIGQQTSNFNNNTSWYGGSFTKTVLTYTYYFLTADGEIILFTEKKRDLYHIMRDKEPDVKKYMKTYNLQQDKKGDLTRIVAYYNALII